MNPSTFVKKMHPLKTNNHFTGLHVIQRWLNPSQQEMFKKQFFNKLVTFYVYILSFHDFRF